MLMKPASLTFGKENGLLLRIFCAGAMLSLAFVLITYGILDKAHYVE
jgi:hypothetical protein